MFLGPKSRLNGIELKFSLELKPPQYRKIWVRSAEELFLQLPESKLQESFIESSSPTAAVLRCSRKRTLSAFGFLGLCCFWAASGLLKAGSFGQLTEYWVAADANIRLIIECVSVCIGGPHMFRYSLCPDFQPTNGAFLDMTPKTIPLWISFESPSSTAWFFGNSCCLCLEFQFPGVLFCLSLIE